jgi:SAM-dependent methyltransferase
MNSLVSTIDSRGHLYFVWFIKQIPHFENLKVLDYGCGRGEIVELLRREGVDCYGADVCIEGGSYPELFESELFRNGTIRAIDESGFVSFENNYFDVIISNQVMEHVPDKDSTMRSLDRVLKSSGIMYHHFPSREVIREGHIGIPMVHWLSKSKFRYYYTITLRRLGLGYFKDQGDHKCWTLEKLAWIDNHCFYEKYPVTYHRLAEHYSVSHREIDYCLFRSRDNRFVHWMLGIRYLKEFYQHIFRRFGFMAIELRKLGV